jgi:hypothetical protein
MNRPTEIFVLTRLAISPEGHVVAENIGATFDIYLAEAHRAHGVENDFERHPISANWYEHAERSSVVAAMREFCQIVEQMQAEALR